MSFHPFDESNQTNWVIDLNILMVGSKMIKKIEMKKKKEEEYANFFMWFEIAYFAVLAWFTMMKMITKQREECKHSDKPHFHNLLIEELQPLIFK